jgi:dihydroorotate dehydrogenase (fumarate)
MIDLSKTIDLSTTYLGLKLKNPLVASSSPMCEDVANIRRMEDAGAAAVVLHSLFEEQIEVESDELDRFLTETASVSSEATTSFPELNSPVRSAEGYLEHIAKCKKAVKIPIIASLNGTTKGGWLRYRQGDSAGRRRCARAEHLLHPDRPQPHRRSGRAAVHRLVQAIRAEVRIPLAVKLGPYFSSLANMGQKLDAAGVDGLVLFNRFYQPDYDLEELEVVPNLILSNSHELLLRLHWIAVLYGNIKADMALTGGVHTATDVIKAMMAGAKVAMMTSALLKRGISYLDTLSTELLVWMGEHEYDSIKQMQGSMSRNAVPQPKAFERANYVKVLSSYAMR